MSHPAAKAYYASLVGLLAEEYAADLIKADCMMCGPCVSVLGLAPGRSYGTAWVS